MADPLHSESGSVTQFLLRVQEGDRQAAERLFPLVYDELRRLARSYMRRERPDHSLQATALVHEAYIKVFGNEAPALENRSQFFGVAAQAMRRILVDHARSRHAEKRGGQVPKLSLDEGLVLSDELSSQIIALDEALQRLADLNPRQVRVVELRFFAGLSIPETAEAMQVATRTVVREWTVARAWLQRELSA
jgi:RNA polymerase sigma-70 factor, ECF subfamily